jgi:hypothetical protein
MTYHLPNCVMAGLVPAIHGKISGWFEVSRRDLSFAGPA